MARKIRSSDTGGIIIGTGFTGALTVLQSALAGISSDAAFAVQLSSDDCARGRLEFDPAAGEQRLTGTALGKASCRSAGRSTGSRGLACGTNTTTRWPR